MKKLHSVIALGLIIGLTACNEERTTSVMEPATSAPAAATPAPADSSPVLATVNGAKITQNVVALHTQQRNLRRPAGASEQTPEQVLQEVINLELMSQAAVKQGLDQKPEIAVQIAHQRRGFLAGAAVQQFMKDNPVGDDDIKALYDEKFGNAGTEYKARHILLETEEEANNIIAELDKGGDFASLAKEHSTGPTGKNGGDLGWFSATQMVAPFSEAAAKLEKNTYTKSPVQTQFGWHVILLEDSRDATPPDFEQIKSQLQMVTQNQRLQEYVDSLRTDASINVVQENP